MCFTYLIITNNWKVQAQVSSAPSHLCRFCVVLVLCVSNVALRVGDRMSTVTGFSAYVEPQGRPGLGSVLILYLDQVLAEDENPFQDDSRYLADGGVESALGVSRCAGWCPGHRCSGAHFKNSQWWQLLFCVAWMGDHSTSSGAFRWTLKYFLTTVNP